MLTYLIKARLFLAIIALALLVVVPAQTSRADAASCAEAVAEAVNAHANMEIACREFGSGSTSCSLASSAASQATVAAALECSRAKILE